MESQQSVMLQRSSNVVISHVSSKTCSISDVQNSSNSTSDFGVQNSNKLTPLSNKSDEVIGVVKVFIHQARDIHNVCIYHKQDVYAKLCLTSDPDTTVSTQIVNGGGKNPVFNENVSLNVRTVDTLVKCEIWMLSRVRNYLEDQLLGFALVSLSDVLKENGGKLSKEFTLSSTDLFHSPAGFVELSFAYIGSCPDVLEVSAATPNLTSVVNGNGNGLGTVSSDTEELEKLEFPDPNLLKENHLMVSEYFELACTDLDQQDSFGFATEENSAQVKSVVKPSIESSIIETITSSTVANNESASSQSVRTTSNKLPNNKPDASEAESGGSSNIQTQDLAKPELNVLVESDNKVVQQDYVDMYLKSMQQFTDSLAKMKLPIDIENNSSEDSPISNGNKGTKVFYGSRAFF